MKHYSFISYCISIDRKIKNTPYLENHFSYDKKSAILKSSCKKT